MSLCNLKLYLYIHVLKSRQLQNQNHLRVSVFIAALLVSKLKKERITYCCIVERKNRNREDQKNQRERQQNYIHCPLRWQPSYLLLCGN